MAELQQFSCLGIQAFGMCNYNPAEPSNVYFDIGGAITALGFILAIQQFLKPIYLFRLKAYRLKLEYMLIAILAGAIFAFIATLLPNLNLKRDSALTYPVVWEMLAGFLIVAAYSITAFIAMRPPQISEANYKSYIRSGADLLSAADDADRISFAEDFLKHPENLERLIKFASAWKNAEEAAYTIEFERLRAIGAPLSIQGRLPISAFYAFAHRKELERASYAGSFLRVISDYDFCATLVCKRPWLIASTLKNISEGKIHTDQADAFVQQVACQAILRNDSIMAKEVSYEGFGTAPLLTESLFGDWFILSQYDPLSGLSFMDSDKITEGYVSRFNGASRMMLNTALRSGDWWPQRYMYSLERGYENIFRAVSSQRYKKLSNNFPVNLHMGVRELYKSVSKGLDAIKPDVYQRLYAQDTERHIDNLSSIVGSIVYESVAAVANSFEGFNDEAWHHTISTFMDLYPSYAKEVGMNPLQQQLAIQLIKKLKNNLNGWYPAVSRVLLSVMGPYNALAKDAPRNAHAILQDAVYGELKNLPELYASKPDKIMDFLPPNVSYDPSKKALIHTYSDKETKVTELSSLDIPEVNLFDGVNWQKPPAN